MPQAREFDAKKAERITREARYYTPDRLGKKCPECQLAMPADLVEAGMGWHPCCGREAKMLLALDLPRQ